MIDTLEYHRLASSQPQQSDKAVLLLRVDENGHRRYTSAGDVKELEALCRMLSDIFNKDKQ